MVFTRPGILCPGYAITPPQNGTGRQLVSIQAAGFQIEEPGGARDLPQFNGNYILDKVKYIMEYSLYELLVVVILLVVLRTFRDDLVHFGHNLFAEDSLHDVVVVAFQDVGWQLLFLGGLSHDEPRFSDRQVQLR